MTAFTWEGICKDLIEGIHIKCPGHSKCSVKRATDSDGGGEVLEPQASALAPPHLGAEWFM